MKKIKDWSLDDYQAALTEYCKDPAHKNMQCFRIDGTPFSTARHFGGFTFNGENYRVVYFKSGALLGVSSTFDRWIKKWVEKQEGGL